jgi:hypothetical protein
LRREERVWYENMFAFDQLLSDMYNEDTTGGDEENNRWYIT